MKENIKKKLTKKYNNIFLLCLVSLVAIILPCSVIGALNVNEEKVNFVGADKESSNREGSGGSCVGGQDYCFISQGTSDLTGFDLITDKDGNVRGAIIQNDKDRDLLIEAGVPEDQIYYVNEIKGYPAGSLEDSEKGEKWDAAVGSYADDFGKQNADGSYTINEDNMMYIIGTIFDFYTGDTDVDTKKLASGNNTEIHIERGVFMWLDGEKKLVTSSNVNSVCAGKINQNTPAGSFCRAVRDTYAKYTDKAETESMSCVEKLMAQGYTSSKAELECCEGGTGPGEACCELANPEHPEKCKKKTSCKEEVMGANPHLSEADASKACCESNMVDNGVPGGFEARKACCKDEHKNPSANEPGGACCEFFHSKEECDSCAIDAEKDPSLSEPGGACCELYHSKEYCASSGGCEAKIKEDPSVGEPGGECCTYFHAKEYCEGGNGDDDGPDDDDDVPKDYEWNYEMCPASSPVTPVYLSPRTPNTPVNTGGSCGGTATSIEYDYSTMYEGLVVLEKQTTITIDLQGLDSNVYYAGNSFSWKKSGGTITVQTRIFDTSALQNKISEVQTKIVNHENKISQLECTIKNIEKTSSSDSCKNLEGIAHEQCVKAIDSKKEEAIKSIQIQLEQLKNDSEYKNALSDLERYKGYVNDVTNYVPTYTSRSETAAVNSEYISFTGTDKTYKKGEIVGVMKNSGEPLTRISEEISNGDDNYLSILSDYYVPVSIKNGTRGLAQRSVSLGSAAATYTCQFSVANSFRCTGDDCEKGLNIIYRPISLSNPFPSTNGKNKYRAFGQNWSEKLINDYIINNRNVKEYDVYNLKPLYTITLTPSTIKSIRNYNKKHSMNDFNLSCTEGYDCISKFLWEEYNNIIDTSNSCATANGLDEECYRGGAS